MRPGWSGRRLGASSTRWCKASNAAAESMKAPIQRRERFRNAILFQLGGLDLYVRTASFQTVYESVKSRTRCTAGASGKKSEPRARVGLLPSGWGSPMKQEQCPHCGRPYLRARTGEPPAQCRGCQKSLRPQSADPADLPSYAKPNPARRIVPAGPMAPSAAREGVNVAKVVGLGAVAVLLLSVVVGVVLMARGRGTPNEPELASAGDSAAVRVDATGADDPAGSGEMPPGAASQGSAPVGGGAPPGSMASRWVLSDQIRCADVVFANSVIGLGDFDEDYLASGDADSIFASLREALEQARIPQRLHRAMEADLLVSVVEMGLASFRPLFAIGLVPEQAGAGDAVGVWLQASGASAELFELPPEGRALVSATGEVGLDPRVVVEGLVSGTNRVHLKLPWNHGRLRELKTECRANIMLSVQFKDGSVLSKPWQFEVRPVAEVEKVYPWGLGYTACANETHPWARELLTSISNDPALRRAGGVLAGGGGNKCQQLFSVYLVWRELSRRQLKYSNLVAAAHNAQRVRLFDEILRDKNANCVDGSALLAGLLQAQAIPASLVLVPGHCLLGVDIGDRMWLLETTKLGLNAAGADVSKYSNDLIQEFECGDKAEWFKAFEGDPSFKTFWIAVSEGEKFWQSRIDELTAAYEEAWASHRPGDSLDGVLQAAKPLSNELRIVPIAFARQLGVKPITPPQDIGPLPK